MFGFLIGSNFKKWNTDTSAFTHMSCQPEMMHLCTTIIHVKKLICTWEWENYAVYGHKTKVGSLDKNIYCSGTQSVSESKCGLSLNQN